MAGALRMVTLARGQDPRDFALFAFGGAGPLHVVAQARELGIPTVIIPIRPGITSAIGCVVADVRHDYVNTVNAPLDVLDMDQFTSILDAQVKEGRETIEREGVEVEDLQFIHDADMQFVGQSHILTVPLPSTGVSRDELRKLFEEVYWERFAVDLPEIKAVLVNLHTAVIGRRKSTDLSSLAPREGNGGDAVVATRNVWYQSGWQETPIYHRDNLPPGSEFDGPAIVEQLDTTTVIEPDCHVTVDSDGNLIVTVGSLAETPNEVSS